MHMWLVPTLGNNELEIIEINNKYILSIIN